MRYSTIPLIVGLFTLQVSLAAKEDGDCPYEGTVTQYLQQLEQRMNQHDTEAGMKLAEYYHQGRCRKRDYAKSREIYEQLAQGGNAEAEFRLGLIHLNGFGVPANKIVAEKWLNKAISHNHPTAREFLEYMQEIGFDDC